MRIQYKVPNPTRWPQMMEFLEDFLWRRDPKGYRWVEMSPPDPASIPSRWIKTDGEKIVGNGGEPIWYPLKKYPTLFSFFSTLKSAEDLMDFTEKFGLLYEFEPVVAQDALKQAAQFRRLLAGKQRGPKQVASVLASILEGDEPFDLRVWWSLKLEPNSLVGLRFGVEVVSLLSALWLQLIQSLRGDAKLRECLHCGGWFEVGPGTGRRLDAKFCSDPHRVLCNSLKRTKGE
jgi:hypothetical protein